MAKHFLGWRWSGNGDVVASDGHAIQGLPRRCYGDVATWQQLYFFPLQLKTIKHCFNI